MFVVEEALIIGSAFVMLVSSEQRAGAVLVGVCCVQPFDALLQLHACILHNDGHWWIYILLPGVRNEHRVY